MPRAFVSSTYRDLKKHRAFVIERLQRSGVAVDPMEMWTAASDEPRALSQERVRDCDICILLVGFRRGFIPAGESRSITQMEFDEARRNEIAVLVFLASEDADWPPDSVADLKRDNKIRRWRKELEHTYTVSYFGPEPRSLDVDSALLRWYEDVRKGKGARPTPTDDDSFAIRIRAYSNSNSVLIAWRPTKPIPGCLGFALYRRCLTSAGIVEVRIHTHIGLNAHPPQPSETAPIQKFSWVDIPLTDEDTRYRVVPVFGSPEALKETSQTREGSGWTAWVSRKTAHTPAYQSFFNRALRSAQASRLLGKHARQTESHWLRLKPGDDSPSRDYYGGELRSKLLQMLRIAKENRQRVFAALSEVDDCDVVHSLTTLGKRLSMILGPGKTKFSNALKESSARIYHVSHLTTSYAVFCDYWGTPRQVWLGSSGWTVASLCTRSNHALLIDSLDLARSYLDHWEALRDRDRSSAETSPVQLRIGETSVTRWGAGARNDGALKDACRVICGAREGVLFVLQPGQPSQAILDEILKLTQDGLLVQGIMSPAGRDPAAKATLYNGIHKQPALIAGAPKIQSNIVLVDPFGTRPAIITGTFGSMNAAPDLLIVDHAAGLASELSIYVLGLFQHLSFLRMAAILSSGRVWHGLQSSDKWQDAYFKPGPKTLDFLFGLIAPGF